MKPLRALGMVWGLCSAACMAGEAAPPPSGPSPQNCRRIAGEVEASLDRDVLDKWFPAALDTQAGGFFENFNDDWSRGATGEKTVVYQSRLTWLSAKAAARDPKHAAKYIELTRHGVAFLADKLWDQKQGGFFWAVDDAGHSTPDRGGEKHVYGIAFAIYAAIASHEVTHDAPALDLAKEAFLWLEAHAHDGEHGGYFEALGAEGQPILTAATRPTDAIGTHYGYKSMNTHIHVLEALTSLQEVWPDATVKARLSEVFEIVRDKIYTDPGCLHLYFNPDWRPVPELDSFGHDLETAYLFVEAAAALGKSDDARTWTVARNLVDHALTYGFDHERGGFHNEATTFGRDVAKDKIWWVQAEGLNALLLMHQHFGRQTPKYWEAFEKQWRFISEHQIDAARGGWYPLVSADGDAPAGRAKSDRWTEGYHQGRALLNVAVALRRLE